VAHDEGLRTGHYASKSKFGLFEESWDAGSGAVDAVPPDYGTDKIDVYVNNSNTSALTGTWLADMTAAPQDYSFIHYADPDSAGHSYGWDPTPGSSYSNSVVTVDGYLGTIFNLIDTNATFTGRTAIVLTADHGGTGTDHSNNSIVTNYTVPFYVWGPGVASGGDLYALNPATLQDPGTGRPDWSAPVQPIRSGDAPNLALDLLGLGPIPGSGVNAAQDLEVPEPATIIVLAGGFAGLLTRGRGRRRAA
jgi:hypothetical protein